MKQPKHLRLEGLLIFAITACLYFAVLVPSVQAATLLVSTTVDEFDGGGTSTGCSIREAIAEATTPGSFPECGTGTAGADIISVPAGVYTLSSTLSTTSEITIQGAGATSTIIQASTCDPTPVSPGCTTATYPVITNRSFLSIDGVTLRHGSWSGVGGAISNTLLGAYITSISNSIITKNVALRGGGIGSNLAIGTIENTIISNNRAGSGGGISVVSNSVALGAINEIINTQIIDNTATSGDGGGINMSGNSTRSAVIGTISHSTIANNSAQLTGINYGGGISLYYATITDLINSTISGNSLQNGSASGIGGRSNARIANIISVTISNNTRAGISGVSGNNIIDTIIANNDTVGVGYVNCGATLSSYTVKDSLSDDNSCNFGTGNSAIVPGTDYSTTLADAGCTTPLADGTCVLVHELLVGSAAIDAGTCHIWTGGVDERGFSRDSSCDTGAFEYIIPPDLTVAKSNDAGGVTTTNTPWTWTVIVSNIGDGGAAFSAGQTILRDELPAGPTYSNVQITSTTDITESNAGALVCEESGGTLSCYVAAGETVDMAALSGSFTVTVDAVSATTGIFNSPDGGVCQVDPDDLLVETSEINNDCADSVEVIAPTQQSQESHQTNAPAISDPAITKRGSVDLAEVGEMIVWTVEVFNPGSSPTDNSVYMRDFVPDAFLVSGVSVAGDGVIVSDDQTVEVSIGVLDPGERVTITITTIAQEGFAGQACNTAAAHFSGGPEATDCVLLGFPNELPTTGGRPVELPQRRLSLMIGLVLAVTGAGAALLLRQKTVT